MRRPILYFFIPKTGELYERLLTDGEVNVSYADPGQDSYVSLSGQARFVDDLAQKEALWSPATQAWFPGGHTDPELALLAGAFAMPNTGTWTKARWSSSSKWPKLPSPASPRGNWASTRS